MAGCNLLLWPASLASASEYSKIVLVACVFYSLFPNEKKGKKGVAEIYLEQAAAARVAPLTPRRLPSCSPPSFCLSLLIPPRLAAAPRRSRALPSGGRQWRRTHHPPPLLLLLLLLPLLPSFPLSPSPSPSLPLLSPRPPAPPSPSRGRRSSPTLRSPRRDKGDGKKRKRKGAAAERAGREERASPSRSLPRLLRPCDASSSALRRRWRRRPRPPRRPAGSPR